ERRLFDLGHTAHVVDPTDEDLRSMVAAAKACTFAGLITICAFPSYRREDRALVEKRLGAERFLEVHVNTSEAVCRVRRPEASFSGFEPPERPEVTVSLDHLEVDQPVDLIIHALERRGQLPKGTGS